MNINNERLNVAARQPLPSSADTHAKNFSAAKGAAERSKDDNVPKGAPQFRGPPEKGATGGSSPPKAGQQAGPDGGSATLHAAGREGVTKAKMDSAIDKAKGDLDSMSEMGEMESLRLQMAMDRMSKMMSTLSNVMKQVSDTERAITGNLK